MRLHAYGLTEGCENHVLITLGVRSYLGIVERSLYSRLIPISIHLEQEFSARRTRLYLSSLSYKISLQQYHNQSILSHFAPIGPLHRASRTATGIRTMSTSNTASQLRSLYRSLLRELPSRSQRSPLHQRLRTSFASNDLSASPSISPLTQANVSDPTSTTSKVLGKSKKSPEEAIQEAEQFLLYVKSQRMYATLLERYNPGMNMDEEERVRLSARRVGMEMPKEWESGKNE